MTKIPKYFGDISEEEMQRINDNTREFENNVAEFQRRPVEDNSVEDNSDVDSIRDRCKKGPILKSYTITRIKT